MTDTIVNVTVTAIAPRVAKSLSRASKLRGHIARRGRNFAIAPFVGLRSASAGLGRFEGEKVPHLTGKMPLSLRQVFRACGSHLIRTLPAMRTAEWHRRRT